MIKQVKSSTCTELLQDDEAAMLLSTMIPLGKYNMKQWSPMLQQINPRVIVCSITILCQKDPQLTKCKEINAEQFEAFCY